MSNVIYHNFNSDDIFDNAERDFDRDGMSDEVISELRTSIEFFKISGYYGYTSVSLIIDDLSEKGYYLNDDFTMEDIKNLIEEI